MSNRAERPRRGRPPRFTQTQVVAAARAILEREGVAALTMRRLADTIGAAPMALYGHVANKDELLVLVLDAEAREIDVPPLPKAPRDRIVAVTLVIHAFLSERPWALDAIRPGERFALSALPLAEEIIAGFVNCGLPLDAAAHAYRSLWFLITGELLMRRHPAESPSPRRLMADIDSNALPSIAALADRWETVEHAYDLEPAIIALVDGTIAAESEASA